MQLTITDGAEGLATIDVDPDAPMENVQALISVELGIPEGQQALFVDGRPLSGAFSPAATLRSCGVADANSILLVTRKQQQAPRQSHGSDAPTPTTAAAGPSSLAGTVDNLLRTAQQNPDVIQKIASQGGTQLARAVANQDRAETTRIMEREIRIQQDPFSLEAQQAIEERIQERNVEENLVAGLEHNPEAFASVVMLYINTRLNNLSLVAFVDTGAQRTIISERCAEQFGLTRLIDKRMGGIAKGVGTSRITGRIHLVVLEVAGLHLECSMSVLENNDVDFILGLDMLRKHRAVVDLEENVLRIQDRTTSFLAEKDIPNKFEGGESS